MKLTPEERTFCSKTCRKAAELLASAAFGGCCYSIQLAASNVWFHQEHSVVFFLSGKATVSLAFKRVFCPPHLRHEEAYWWGPPTVDNLGPRVTALLLLAELFEDPTEDFENYQFS